VPGTKRGSPTWRRSRHAPGQNLDGSAFCPCKTVASVAPKWQVQPKIAGRQLSGTGRGSAHHRRWRSTPSEERLRTLGERIPVSVDASIDREKVARFGRRIVAAVVVVLVALMAVLWFTVSSPVFRSAVSTSVLLRGALPPLPWPTTGSAALSVASQSFRFLGATRSPFEESGPSWRIGREVLVVRSGSRSQLSHDQRCCRL
jgi:hypothetical protein